MRIRSAVLVALYALTLSAAACRDDDAVSQGGANPSAPTATATASGLPATVTPTATPTGTRRPGVPDAVNTIINLVLAGDVAGVQQYVSLVTLPCGPQQRPGSPPACPTGQPNGTPV